MNPITAMKQLARYAGTVPGLSVDYPATNRITVPHMMLWLGEGDIVAQGEQLWRIRPKGQLLGSVKGGDLKTDFINIERFIPLLVDLFNPENHQAYHLQDPETGDIVDLCRVSSFRSGLDIAWMGPSYYAAEIFWDIKLRRTAGDTT